MKRTAYSIALLAFSLLFAQCGQDKSTTTETTTQQPDKYEPPAREEIKYTITSAKDSASMLDRYDENQQWILMAANRMDLAHLKKADSLLMPDKFADVNQYCPFPFYVPELREVHKMVFFSYPAQAFAAYENGKLAKWGPTNMGREKDQTPTGLYFANWKSEETTSTFDDEWVLKWNFNIENKEGIGWHQYELPGYPASHSCLRMLEQDAKFMYEWADEWVLKSKEEVEAKGTPVLVFGSYPFGAAKPWFALPQNPKALDITADQMKEMLQPHLQTILTEQKKQPATASINDDKNT